MLVQSPHQTSDPTMQQLPLLKTPAHLASVADIATTQAFLAGQGCTATVCPSSCSSFHYLSSCSTSWDEHEGPATAELEFVVPVSSQARHLTPELLFKILEGVPAGPQPAAAGGAGSSSGSGDATLFKGVSLAVVDGSVVSQVQLISGLQPPPADSS